MDEQRETVGLTIRELVLELRQDIKALDTTITNIDRDGPIGMRSFIQDHETRIRHTERWVYGIPIAALMGLAGIAVGLFTNQPL